MPKGPPSEALTQPSAIAETLARLGEYRAGFQACLDVVIADRMFAGWTEIDARAYAEKLRSLASTVPA